jgi:hypothetical protein
MRRQALRLFVVLAWLWVAGVIIQVGLAGLGLFEVTGMDLHVGFGYTLPYLPMIMMVVVLAAWPGRRLILLTLALMIMGSFVQPTLPWFRGFAPPIAALHPANALLIFWLGIVVARRATDLVRATGAAAQPVAADRG